MLTPDKTRKVSKRSIAMVYEKHSEHGDLMTMEEFIWGCENGPALIDYDGYGYYALENCQTKIVVVPSMLKDGTLDTTFTHVMWFNR